MAFITFRYRRDTSANWASANPVLGQGELGFETDTSVIKVGNGSTSYNSLPITRLITSGEVAKLADIASNADVTNTTNVTAAGALMRSGGTMTGALNMGGQTITNLPTPATGSAPATKTYVDTAISGVGSGSGNVVGPLSSTDNALMRFDGTTGQLAQNSVVTISDTGSISIPVGQTVDGRDISVDGTKLDNIESLADVTDTTNVTAAGALMRSGGTMTGALNMGGFVLNGLPAPTTSNAASTRQYVDDTVAAAVIGAGSGDLVGPSSATNDAIMRFDGTTGKLSQNSLVTISDTGSITIPGGQTVGGRNLASDGSKLDGLASNDTNIRAVVVSATPPTAGQILTATTATAASWQSPGALSVTEANVRSALSAATGAVSVNSQAITGFSCLTPSAPSTQSFSSSLSVDVAARNDHRIGALTANCAVTLTGLTDGAAGTIRFLQDGTGGRTITSFTASGVTFVQSKGQEGSSLQIDSAANSSTLISYYMETATRCVLAKCKTEAASFSAETGSSYSSSDVSNISTVAGSTVTAALNTLKTLTDGHTSSISTIATKANITLTVEDVPASTYTHILTDTLDRIKTFSNSGTKTFTIAPNASVATPIGQVLTGVNLGSGLLTLSPGAGVTLTTPTGYGLTVILGGMFTLLKVATNQWVVSGTQAS